MTKSATAEERVAARFRSRWLRHYVPWKLRFDPLYNAAFEVFSESSHPLLDLGCGVGLLALYLRERGLTQPILGIDTDGAKIEAATEIARNYSGVSFVAGDARAFPLFRGSLALLDVLHYMPDDEQHALVERVAESVAPGGAVVIRDAIRDGSWRYRMTYMEESLATAIGWLRVPMLRFPAVETIVEPFRRRSFEATVTPLWGRTPFNNYLFVFRRPASS